MAHEHPTPAPRSSTPASRTGLGLPLWAIAGLAMLSVPRVFAHDLGLDSGPVYAVLTLGPPAVWVLVALRARVPSPVLTLLAVGAVYGVALGVVHNILWDEVFDGEEPVLGELDRDLSELVLRGATLVSSVFTGAVVGLISGLVATAVRSVSARRQRQR